MYWLGRPPYLRWSAAVAILAVGLYAEFRPQRFVEHPFALHPISVGEGVTAVEWRRIPAGVLEAPDLAGSRASVDIAEGEAIVNSMVTRGATVPSGWWSIAVPLGYAAPAGTAVRLVDTSNGTSTSGIVVAGPSADPLAIDPTALVAVPPSDAPNFAVAADAGQVTVLIGGS